jgi:hydroxyacylglutathione hydrolase
MKISEKLYAYIWRDTRANNCNTYIVRSGVTILIDPGHRMFLPRLFQGMKRDGLDPEEVKLVLLTHCHPDHMEGSQDFCKMGARVAMSREEENFLKEIGPYFARMMGMKMPEVALDFYLQEGDLTCGEERFRVLSTPGHSPGEMSLLWEETGTLLSGDVIFPQGVGRTDFPGGDGTLLKASIDRLRTYKPAMLLSGHGEIISGAEEVERNFEMVRRAYFDYL